LPAIGQEETRAGLKRVASVGTEWWDERGSARPLPERDKGGMGRRAKRGKKRDTTRPSHLKELITQAAGKGIVVDLAAEEKLREASRYLEGVVRKLYPQVSVCRDQVDQLVWDAYKSTDGTYGEEEALVWARGYRIPGSVKERDSVGLKLAGSMEIYVTEKQRQMSFEGRLSRQSIIAAGIPETDPDYSRLMDLVDGITIMTDDLFRPNGAAQPLRPKYLRMQSVVDRLMMDLYEAGLILILPTDEVEEIDGSHFSASSWALKKDKEWGRPIGDASAPSENTGVALNSAAVALMCIERWGSINHPTVSSLCALVMAETSGSCGMGEPGSVEDGPEGGLHTALHPP